LVDRYIQKVESLLHHYRIDYKIQTLKSKWNDTDARVQKEKLDSIDKQNTELLLCTERQCRNLRAGAVAYSPNLSKVGL